MVASYACPWRSSSALCAQSSCICQIGREMLRLRVRTRRSAEWGDGDSSSSIHTRNSLLTWCMDRSSLAVSYASAAMTLAVFFTLLATALSEFHMITGVLAHT